MSLNHEASEFIQSKLTCSICQNTCVEPYILGTCNHIYCWGCINGTKTDNSRYIRCPACRTRSKLPKFYNNNPINDILSNIKSDEYNELKKDYYDDKHFREQLRLYQKTKKYENARKFVLRKIIKDELIHYDDFKKMPQVVDEITLNIILSSTSIWNQIVLVNNYVMCNDAGCISDFMVRHEMDERSVNCLLHNYLDMEVTDNVGQVEELSPLYAKIYMFTEKKRKLILKYFQDHPFGPVSDDEESDDSEDSETTGTSTTEEYEDSENDNEEQDQENHENEQEQEYGQEHENQENQENAQDQEDEVESSEVETEDSQESRESYGSEENEEGEEDVDRRFVEQQWDDGDVRLMRSRAHMLSFMYHSGDRGDTDDRVLRSRVSLHKTLQNLAKDLQIAQNEDHPEYMNDTELGELFVGLSDYVYGKYKFFLYGQSASRPYMLKDILSIWDRRNTDPSNYSKLPDIIRFRLLYSFVRLMRYEVKHNYGNEGFCKEYLSMIEEFEQKLRLKLEGSPEQKIQEPESSDEQVDPSMWKTRMRL